MKNANALRVGYQLSVSILFSSATSRLQKVGMFGLDNLYAIQHHLAVRWNTTNLPILLGVVEFFCS